MKSILRVIRDIPQYRFGDGFPVRSLFSYAHGNRSDPFLLLDYAGPHRFTPGETNRGFGESPFVMNTREEIRQAIRDYRDGRMGQLA